MWGQPLRLSRERRRIVFLVRPTPTLVILSAAERFASRIVPRSRRIPLLYPCLRLGKEFSLEFRVTLDNSRRSWRSPFGREGSFDCGSASRSRSKILAQDDNGIRGDSIRKDNSCDASQSYGSTPNTATPLGVPTNTFPFTIIGVMNLLPEPNWSRPPLA